MGYDMSIRSDRPVNDEALLKALNKEWNAAIKVRNARFTALGGDRKVAVGTYQEGIDDEFASLAGTYANGDPEYAAAQREVMRISDEIDKARRDYFRLNIWGMGQYRDVMEAVGMGFWPEHMLDWPKPEAFGLDNDKLEKHRYPDEEWTQETPPLTEDEVKACEAFDNEIERVKSAHLEEIPGIPLNKFCSNDGWHVTPPECKSALELFGKFLVPGYNGRSYTPEEALAAFRKADEDERKVVLDTAITLNAVENEKVGHPPFMGDQDNRRTLLDALVEDYWLRWLDYLETASQYDGFEVW